MAARRKTSETQNQLEAERKHEAQKLVQQISQDVQVRMDIDKQQENDALSAHAQRKADTVVLPFFNSKEADLEKEVSHDTLGKIDTKATADKTGPDKAVSSTDKAKRGMTLKRKVVHLGTKDTAVKKTTSAVKGTGTAAGADEKHQGDNEGNADGEASAKDQTDGEDSEQPAPAEETKRKWKQPTRTLRPLAIYSI